MLRGLRVWSMLINGNLIDKNLWWAGFSHGSWYQTTSSDLGYPVFLFVAGIALSYSFQSSKKKSNTDFFFKLFWRAIRLIALGVVLKAMPGFVSFSVMGTLQCIGYAVIIAGAVICGLGEKFAAPVAIILQLLGYLLAITLVDWPTRWAENSTFFEILDLQLIGHTGGVEGVITTFLASSFVLLGFSLKHFLSSSSIFVKSALGLILMAVGLGFQHLPSTESVLYIPIIPSLFTLSFSLYTVGSSFLLLALFEFLLKLPLSNVWKTLLLPFGRNSIFAYAGSSI